LVGLTMASMASYHHFILQITSLEVIQGVPGILINLLRMSENILKNELIPSKPYASRENNHKSHLSLSESIHTILHQLQKMSPIKAHFWKSTGPLPHTSCATGHLQIACRLDSDSLM
jgi:hypothetical protein